MKNTWILLLTLLSIVFCGNVYASDGEDLAGNDEMDTDAGFEANLENAEINYSDNEVWELLDTLERGLNPAQFNGMRVKLPNKSTIWIIEGGKRRKIPTVQTYKNLFKNWNGIQESMWISQLPVGKPLPHSAVLFRTFAKVVHITDHGVRRPMTIGAFKRYNFDKNKVLKIPDSIMRTIPLGPKWR